MLSILIIVGLSALGAIGDVLLKKAGEASRNPDGWLFLGVLAYVLTIPGWFYVLKHLPLASIGVIYSISTILILVGIGTIWFDERLSGIELLGVACAVIAALSLRRLI